MVKFGREDQIKDGDRIFKVLRDLVRRERNPTACQVPHKLRSGCVVCQQALAVHASSIIVEILSQIQMKLCMRL